jgi:hypothetical protein
MEYNTSREFLLMREYGRHVQKMVDYLLTIEDQQIRKRNAEAVIELMSFINPQLKTIEDYRHKLWDHLYVMSDFKLDVIDSPYPKPDRATYKSRPQPLEYPKRHPRYNHLGKNLELVIDKAMKEENPEKKSGFAHVIAHYMKLAYSTWHKELVHDDSIRQELNSITKGELEFTNTPFVRHRAASFRDEDSFPPKRSNKFKLNRSNNNNNNRQQQQPGNGNGNRENRGGNNNAGGGGNRNPNNRGNAKFGGKKRF